MKIKEAVVVARTDTYGSGGLDVGDVFGIYHAMDNFTGRKQQ